MFYQEQCWFPGSMCAREPVGAGAVPRPLLPLLPLQQPLLLQPFLLQPNNIFHVHADTAAHHWPHISGKNST
jgi:hypothetical protein